MSTLINTNREVGEPAPADQDWFGGRRWTGILAAGVLILAALSVIVVFSVHHSNRTGSGPGRQPGAGPSTPSTGRAPITGGPALATDIPSTAPTGVVWTIFETVALPTRPAAGPARVDGAIATGYAHTPLGALLATANESYRFVLADDEQWRAAADAMLAPTEGKAAWLKTRSAGQYGPGGASGAGEQFAQIAAFQFVSYSPSDAVIQIVTRDENGGFQVAAEHVTWIGGDWRYVTSPDGGQTANVAQIPSITGFVEWRGV
jgi:hypothetical protein